jgi:hypothetical protein
LPATGEACSSVVYGVNNRGLDLRAWALNFSEELQRGAWQQRC